MTDKQLIANTFESPWVFKRLNKHDLDKVYQQAQHYLKFWKNDPHQNQAVTTAIAQHQYAVKLIKHVMNLASTNS